MISSGRHLQEMDGVILQGQERLRLQENKGQNEARSVGSDCVCRCLSTSIIVKTYFEFYGVKRIFWHDLISPRG